MYHRFSVALGTILLGIIAFAAGSSAQHTFTEDFTTTDFKDVGATTADWNTTDGELKLFPFTPHLAGSYSTPGGARNLTVAGDLLFVGEDDTGLQIFDITDPANPTLVSTLGGLGDVQGLAVSGDHAFLVDSASGLYVIDISAPTGPVLAGSMSTLGLARDVVIAGDLLYLADGGNGLNVIDISDPTNPVLVDHYQTPDEAWDVAVAGDLAFVADDETGLVVLDITDPANTILVGSYDTPGGARGVKVAGDHVYVADNTSGLQVYDITDPTSLVLTDSYDTPGQAYDVDVVGNLAYVADHLSGLAVIDITDPANLTLAFSNDTPGFAFGVEVSGTFAFVADFTSGIQVLEVGSLMPLGVIGGLESLGQAKNIEVAGNLVFVSAGNEGVQIIDITDPTIPSLVGNYDTLGDIQDVAVAGDMAFLADAQYGLWVIDVSNPALPSYVGDINLPGFNSGVAVAGNLVLVAGGTSGLRLIDISNPAGPTTVGLFDTSGNANSVVVSGDMAFVADGESGLQVIDISDPVNPALLGVYDTPGSANDVAVAGDLAFVADNGLQVIDITDPSNPTYLGSCYTYASACRVAMAGNLAFVVDSEFGLWIIDVSDPGNPVPVHVTPAEISSGFAVSGELAFLGLPSGEFYIAQVFQREVYGIANSGQSLALDGASDVIVRCRLTSTETSGVNFYIDTSSNYNWQHISDIGSWVRIVRPGIDLLWRADLEMHSTISELTLDWLNDSATINSITDVPDDQGRWVRINFTRSGFDFSYDNAFTLTGYWVHQRVDDPALLAQVTDLGVPAHLADGGKDNPELNDLGEVRFLDDRTFIVSQEKATSSMPPGTWEVVGSVPPMQQDHYSVRVPTLADSTLSETNWSTIVVTTHTTVPWAWFASHPDSGYSVDNIAPGVPQSVSAGYLASGVALDWDDASESDFQYHRVYRGSSPDFVPSAATLVHETANSTWIDPTANPWGYHYKITTLDHSGNESEAVSPAGVTDVQDGTVPTRTALMGAMPNPFNPSTKLSFDMVAAGHARLKVFDTAGRLVATLVDERRDAGSHDVIWDGRDNAGRISSAGVYLYRLEVGDFIETKRMTLVK